MPKVALVGADNKRVGEVNKEIIGKILFKETEHKMQFFIVKDMKFDAVLGTDELDRNGGI